MTRRLKMVAVAVAVAAATVIPVVGASSAAAYDDFRVQGVYPTEQQCEAAGAAGYQLWGPVYFCTTIDVYPVGTEYALWVHS